MLLTFQETIIQDTPIRCANSRSSDNLKIWIQALDIHIRDDALRLEVDDKMHLANRARSLFWPLLRQSVPRGIDSYRLVENRSPSPTDPRIPRSTA